MKKSDREMFYYQTGTLMNSGFTVIDALDMLDKRFLKDREVIKANLFAGLSFYKCLDKLQVFETTDLEIIRLSEETGTITNALLELGVMYSESRELKSKLISFAIYPLIMLVLVLAYIVFAIFFMVPMMKDLLSSLNVNDGMIFSFDDFRQYLIFNRTLMVGVISAILFLGFILFRKYNLGLRFVLGSKYKLYHEVAVVDRIAKLIAGGRNIMDTFDIMEKIKGIDTDKIKASLEKGESLTISFQKGGFSKEFCGIIRINEESGNILRGFDMYLKSSRHVLKSVMEKRMKLIEPMSLILIGAVVGVSVVSVMGPLTEAFTKIN